MGWRGPSCPLGCFSGLFFSFKLEKEKGKPACLQSRLIIAERFGAGTPCMCFHTCADGCVRTLRLGQRRWKVCGSMSASSEAATGGQRRVWGRGGDARGEVRHPLPLACVVVRSNPLPCRQPGGCRSRLRCCVFALTDLLL